MADELTAAQGARETLHQLVFVYREDWSFAWRPLVILRFSGHTDIA